MKVLLDDDGITKQYAHINDDGEVRLYHEEDVTAILKKNEILRNNGEKVKFAQDSMRMIGSVSPLKMFQLIKEGIWYDDKKLRAWFKDLDNYLWNVTRGVK